MAKVPSFTYFGMKKLLYAFGDFIPARVCKPTPPIEFIVLKMCTRFNLLTSLPPDLLICIFPPFQVFSKLSEKRLPSEFEVRELIGNRLSDSQLVENLEKGS